MNVYLFSLFFIGFFIYSNKNYEYLKMRLNIKDIAKIIDMESIPFSKKNIGLNYILIS